MSEINTVVFDVGRVLFDFSFSRFFKLMEDHGAGPIGPDIYQRIDLDAYEHGQISSERFIDRLSALTTRPIDRKELVEHWQNIFTGIPEMLRLAEELKSRYQVLLLSNTSELHWNHLESRHQIENLAHGVVTSFRVGAMKPNPVIYKHAEDTFSLTPTRCVFIDDIQENIDGAKARGWQGIHHRSPETTRVELRALGVSC